MGDSLPFLKRENSVTWFFLCPGVQKFGKCLQSADGAASASPPTPMLPGIARGFPCRWGMLTGLSVCPVPWAVRMGLVATPDGSVSLDLLAVPVV